MRTVCAMLLFLVPAVFSPAFTLVFPKLDFATDSNGVNPDSGPSGTTFTFTVTYTDATITSAAPTRSVVWIDLNGDGTESAGPLVVPFRGSPPASLLLVIIIGGIAVTLTSLRGRLWRVAPAFAAAITLMSCPVALSEAPPQETTEVFEMTGNGTWSTGVVMTATAALTNTPATYNFRFKFKDSNGLDVTNGTASGTLQVTIN
jgi:hypothetical protein